MIGGGPSSLPFLSLNDNDDAGIGHRAGLLGVAAYPRDYNTGPLIVACSRRLPWLMAGLGWLKQKIAKL